MYLKSFVQSIHTQLGYRKQNRKAEMYKDRLCLSMMGKAIEMKTTNSANGFHACQGVSRL